MVDTLEKIANKGKFLFLAYDHGLEHGPRDFDDKSIDPEYILKIALEGGYSGVILQKGVAEKYYSKSPFRKKIPLILKLNGKTRIYQGEPYSAQECSVSFARKLGAFAVGYTIYIGSKYENKMISEFGRIVEDAHLNKVPVIAWVYPRGEAVNSEKDPELVAWAARVGLELGADMVKVKYTGSPGTFKQVVRAAGKVKVVVAGGEKKSEVEFLKEVKEIMESGAVGIAVGRNIWQRKNPLEVTKKVKEIIFQQK